MSIYRSVPTKKIINGKITETSQSIIVMQDSYETNGEDYIIVKDIPFCHLKLNSQTTDRVQIKALTNVLLESDYIIDDEFDEIQLERGSAVELVHINKKWFIMSSDGLKNS